jgi:hypothetical protein
VTGHRQVQGILLRRKASGAKQAMVYCILAGPADFVSVKGQPYFNGDIIVLELLRPRLEAKFSNYGSKHVS